MSPSATPYARAISIFLGSFPRNGLAVPECGSLRHQRSWLLWQRPHGTFTKACAGVSRHAGRVRVVPLPPTGPGGRAGPGAGAAEASETLNGIGSMIDAAGAAAAVAGPRSPASRNVASAAAATVPSTIGGGSDTGRSGTSVNRTGAADSTSSAVGSHNGSSAANVVPSKAAMNCLADSRMAPAAARNWSPWRTVGSTAFQMAMIRPMAGRLTRSLISSSSSNAAKARSLMAPK